MAKHSGKKGPKKPKPEELTREEFERLCKNVASQIPKTLAILAK